MARILTTVRLVMDFTTHAWFNYVFIHSEQITHILFPCTVCTVVTIVILADAFKDGSHDLRNRSRHKIYARSIHKQRTTNYRGKTSAENKNVGNIVKDQRRGSWNE